MGEWVRARWWEEFNDPILNGLMARGLRCSPTLSLAQERLKAAAQAALQKKAALYPELDLNAFDFWAHLSREGFFRAFSPLEPAAINDFFLGLTFTYEFDFWGKNRDLYNAALGEAAARCAETMQAELILTTSIAYTYFELQFLLKKKQIFEERRENRRQAALIRTQRQKGALDTALDPLAARAETLGVDAELSDLEATISAQVHKIKALMGLSQDDPVDVSVQPMKPLPLVLPEKLGLDLIGRRPDLIAQRRRLEAAALKVDAAKTEFYPNLNLMGFLGTESVTWSQLFKAGNYDVGILPALHLPIFTAGKLRAQLYEKSAEFNQAVYTYNETIVQAAREIADSLTKISALLREIKVRGELFDIAKAQESLTLRRFEGAVATKTDTLQAADGVLQKELALSWLEYAAQMAKINLIRALGGGFHE